MPRFRLVLILIGVTLGSIVGTLVALGAPAGADAAGDAGRFLALTNQARATHGVPALAGNGQLTGLAKSWSARLAAAGGLSHNPSLGSQVGGWRSIGENVGMGPSVDSIQQAFINSPDHYRNIMDSAFTLVGVGVTYSGGTVFVTLDFEQPMVAAAAPAPAPVAARPAPVAHPAPAPRPVAPAPRPQPAPQPAAAPAPAPAPPPAPVPAPVVAPAPVAPVTAAVSPRALPDATLPPTDGLSMAPARSSRSAPTRGGDPARPWAVAVTLLAIATVWILGVAEGPAAALGRLWPSRLKAAA